MSQRKTATKATIEARNASSSTEDRSVRSTWITKPTGNSNHTAVKRSHATGSGLSREASATSAYTPPAEVIDCLLSLACATVVGSCVKPIALSIRDMEIPAGALGFTTHHVSATRSRL